MSFPAVGRDDCPANAGHALAARALANGHGPIGVAGELVDALREYRSAVDLLVVNATSVRRAVAMVYGDWTMVCRQESDSVQVKRVRATALADELAGLVSSVQPASTMPVTLPPGVIADTLRLLDETKDGPAARRAVRELVRDRGGDDTVVDQLVGLFPRLTGQGQFGVVRDGTRLTEVSWLDSPRGRVQVHQDGDGWVSINPLRHRELVRLLEEAASAARA